MLKIRPLYFVLLCSLWLSAHAFAHRVGTPTTTIEYNQRSAKWEITHRLSVHDLGESSLLVAGFEDLSREDLGLQVRRYISKHFALMGVFLINFVGAEIEDDQVYAYYEIWAPDQTVYISNTLLMEARATGSALVNINGKGGIQSLTFSRDAGWKGMRLQRPD